MKGRKNELRSWVIVCVLMLMGLGAFVAGPMQVLGKQESAPGDCLYREQANEKHIAVEWLTGNASPVITASIEMAFTKTNLIGHLKCVTDTERHVDWVWDKASPAPTVTWYEVTP